MYWRTAPISFLCKPSSTVGLLGSGKRVERPTRHRNTSGHVRFPPIADIRSKRAATVTPQTRVRTRETRTLSEEVARARMPVEAPSDRLARACARKASEVVKNERHQILNLLAANQIFQEMRGRRSVRLLPDYLTRLGYPSFPNVRCSPLSIRRAGSTPLCASVSRGVPLKLPSRT
jgi:hypothetical protein